MPHVALRKLDTSSTPTSDVESGFILRFSAFCVRKSKHRLQPDRPALALGDPVGFLGQNLYFLQFFLDRSWRGPYIPYL